MEFKDEHELVIAIREKNQDALVALVENYGKLIFYMINKVLTEPQEKQFVDDCYNDVLTVIWFQMDCFDETRGNLKSWMVGISKFKALEFKKKSSKNQTVQLEEIHHAHTETETEDELQEELLEILQHIPEKDRAILLRKYIDGLSIKELADELNVTEGYIYNRISRSKRKIQTIFQGGIEHE